MNIRLLVPFGVMTICGPLLMMGIVSILPQIPGSYGLALLNTATSLLGIPSALLGAWLKFLNFADFNGDGLLQLTDYQAFVDALAKIVPLDPAEVDQMRNVDAPKAWEAMGFDAAKPGSPVSQTAFLTVALKLFTGLIGLGNLNQFVGIIFPHADLNNDSILDQDEFVKLLGLRGVSQADAIKSFTAVDTDGDGKVTQDEINKCAVDFASNTDPNSYCKSALGPTTPA